MKPIFQIAAAAALLALGACSSGLDGGLDRAATTAMMAPAGAPQFAAASAALPGILAEGKAMKVTYVSRASAPVTSGVAGGTCPYARAMQSGVYMAAAAPLRTLGGGQTYRFTNY